MKVEGYKVSHHAGLDFMFFDLVIDGVKTWCCANFLHEFVVIHWRQGGSRYFEMDDFTYVYGDIHDFLEKNLENLPLLDDYDWDKHKSMELEDMEDIEL